MWTLRCLNLIYVLSTTTTTTTKSGCPSCHPTSSVKALKAIVCYLYCTINLLGAVTLDAAYELELLQ